MPFGYHGDSSSVPKSPNSSGHSNQCCGMNTLKMGDRGAGGNVSPILDSAQSIWSTNKKFVIKFPLI